MSEIEKFLMQVQKPSRYLGNEINALHKPWDLADCRWALVFPDLYEIGMSNLGLNILYSVINGLSWALADRCYVPDIDMERFLRKTGYPLFGLENRRPLKDFDVIGISLPYELCYSNVLNILDMAGLPILAADRQSDWPLVIAGGSAAFQPEPIAELFDAILVGDGEEAVKEISSIVRNAKASGASKQEVLLALSAVHGIYVPSFYRPLYENGRFSGMDMPASGQVKRRILADMERAPYPTALPVPYQQIVHDRIGMEIARGCTRGCRFCQAGIIYRPVREKSPQKILDTLDLTLKNTGWDEISLLSLSTGDYSRIQPLLCGLMNRYAEEHIAVSLPSLRVGTLTPALMEQIKRVRKTGFTLAPEAGSERLRQVINKGITEEDLLNAAFTIYKLGWRNLKLYFMIGLPTETEEDVVAIAELAHKVLRQAERRMSVNVTVSVGTFVPKAHTPFQWERQLSVEEARERIYLLRSELQVRSRAIKLKWHDPNISFWEGVFARGDRNTMKILHEAWKIGAKMDAWSDHFSPERYREAAQRVEVDPSSYTNALSLNRPLPWGHIHTGVKMDFLLSERARALKGEYTPDCRRGACQGCGVCDFKTIKPVSQHAIEIESNALAGPKTDSTVKPRYSACYGIRYTKLGDARFLAHLEVMRAMHRAMRRAGLKLAHSEGHHPMPKMSFGQPIPLGMESVAEQAAFALEFSVIFEADRPEQLTNVQQALNTQLPNGIQVMDIKSLERLSQMVFDTRGEYIIAAFLPKHRMEQGISIWKTADTIPVSVQKKDRVVEMDLKNRIIDLSLWGSKPLAMAPMQHALMVQWLNEIRCPENLLYLSLSTEPPFIKPADAMEQLLGLTVDEKNALRILKI
ncbi:MAG: TIGR03960 family B12-binding radical SAM protein [Dissulfuribacterales bacterium]